MTFTSDDEFVVVLLALTPSASVRGRANSQ